MKIDCLLPAGGRLSGDFAQEAGTEMKALISMGGSTLIERTIGQLRSIDNIGRIVAIGPDDIAKRVSAIVDTVIPEGLTGPENIMRGLEWLRDSGGLTDRVLVLTTDLPFVTAQSIDAFIRACPPESDLSAPAIEKAEFEARFPGHDIQYVRLRDGRWTMGCSFLLNPEVLLRNRQLIEQTFSVRKSQLGMARLLGLGFIIKFLTGRLLLEDIVDRCSCITGFNAAAVRGCNPELAYDIDKPEEYRYAVRTLEG